MFNFELKFYLTEHFYAESSRYFSQPAVKRLFCEIDNLCPRCGKPLNWISEFGDISAKENQIAHIYARREFKTKNLPLDKPYHINSLDDIDKYNNLIILCDKCHNTYDTNTSYEKYIEILNLKKQLYDSQDLTKIIYALFDDTMDAIKTSQAFKNFNGEKIIEFDYSRTNLENKLEHNGINYYKSMLIKSNIKSYYITIEDCIEQYEKENGMTSNILSEFHEVYLEYKSRYENKNEIIDLLEKELLRFLDISLADVIKVLIPFMVMKCEVLDNVT